MQKKHSAYVT